MRIMPAICNQSCCRRLFRVPGKGSGASWGATLGLAEGGRLRVLWVQGFLSQTVVDDDTLKPGCPDRGSGDPGPSTGFLCGSYRQYVTVPASSNRELPPLPWPEPYPIDPAWHYDRKHEPNPTHIRPTPGFISTPIFTFLPPPNVLQRG